MPNFDAMLREAITKDFTETEGRKPTEKEVAYRMKAIVTVLAQAIDPYTKPTKFRADVLVRFGG